MRAAAAGLRAPVQVMEGNYKLMSGTCAWWDGVSKSWRLTTPVVPANAGTHNHRALLLAKVVYQYRLAIDCRGLWVPAFAGTTASVTRNVIPNAF